MNEDEEQRYIWNIFKTQQNLVMSKMKMRKDSRMIKKNLA